MSVGSLEEGGATRPELPPPPEPRLSLFSSGRVVVTESFRRPPGTDLGISSFAEDVDPFVRHSTFLAIDHLFLDGPCLEDAEGTRRGDDAGER